MLIIIIVLSVMGAWAANCPCRTTRDNNPVCGSNGVTYTNLSKLKCHNKCNNDSKSTYKFTTI